MKFQKFNIFVSTMLIVLFCFFGFVEAQQTTAVGLSKEDERVARLVGLAKVWGTIKYFHPFLAYREIDWDKALVETIPRVNAAKTPQEYEAAINSMLAVLNDKNTRARVVGEKPKPENQTPTAENKEPILLQNGVLTIDALAVAKAVAGANARRFEFSTKTNQLIPQAKAVLIDLRSAGEPDADASYFTNDYLHTILPAMLDKNVPLAAARYRVHNGYAPQTDSTSGGYYSGLITDAPQTLAGSNKAKTPPLVFLVNENSPAAAEMLGGLQAAKLAFVVQDGESSNETGAATHTIKLPENIEVEMLTTELVGADGTIGFAADLVLCNLSFCNS